MSILGAKADARLSEFTLKYHAITERLFATFLYRQHGATFCFLLAPIDPTIYRAAARCHTFCCVNFLVAWITAMKACCAKYCTSFFVESLILQPRENSISRNP